MEEFTAKEWVLVRSSEKEQWSLAIYSHYDESVSHARHVTLGGAHYRYCISYEGNKELLASDCAAPPSFKDGDVVIDVNYNIHDLRGIFIFRKKCDEGYYGYAGVDYLKNLNYNLFEPWTANIRLANDEERKAFFRRMKKEGGKRWNAEKKRIEDVWQPKDGDFVAWGDRDRPAISIFREGDRTHFSTYASLYRSGGIGIDDINTVLSNDDIFRPATDEEKQKLLEALHEDGKDWDAENKKVVEYKWKPTFGGIYWTLVFDSAIRWKFVSSEYTWKDSTTNMMHLDKGIIFRTEEEADKEAERRNKLLEGNLE